MTKTPDLIDCKIPRHEREILLEELLNVERGKLFLYKPKLSPSQKKKLAGWEDALHDGYPLQYLIGKAHFMDLELFVDENVLIPRPETELLAELALKQKAKNILEVGTGSGCIIIYLATKQVGEFTALDISEKALSVAKKNAKKYASKIDFRKSDLFEKVKGQKFDLIISNLPYGKKSQLKKVRFEPEKAIYGGQNGFEVIERLVSKVKNYMSADAKVLLEIDPSQTKLLQTACEKYGFELAIIKDLNARDRIGVLKSKKDTPVV